MSTLRNLLKVQTLPALMLAATICCGPASLRAQTSLKQVAVPLPPMGWSSWNSFSNTIDSQVVQDQAKAMIASGMKDAGYQYINIDEGWWLGQRDDQGNIVVEAKAWPALTPQEHAGDMANIVRYLHGLGLKAGIYTDAGKYGCSTVSPDLGPSYPNTGSLGHYEQDFLQFAKWGFDYVKVDWCGGEKENLDPAVQYAEIARAIEMAEAATGHPLYYSICNWGKRSPWTWAPGIHDVTADIWRTSGDIVAPIVANSKNSGRKASFPGMLGNFDKGIHPEAEHTGYYNDPDMMVIGMPGLNDTQNRVHMALWAISGAPLLVGADLTTLTDATRTMLTNPEVLGIDQDPLGLQAVKVAEAGAGHEVWAKPLASPGAHAVLLLNRTTSAAPIAVQWSDLGLTKSEAVTIRDVWAKKEIGNSPTSYSATVPAQDAVLLIVRGSEERPVRYEPSGAAKASPLTAEHPVNFKDVTAKTALARVDIAYKNVGKNTVIADLRVNGQTATRIAFPPTGIAAGMVAIEAQVKAEGVKNIFDFSTVDGEGPSIEFIAVH